MKPFRFIFSSAFFIGLIILLLFISFLSYQRINRLNQEEELVFHTDLVKLRLEQVLSYVKDAETSQRGYLLTSDTSFLMPLQSARRKIQETMGSLDSLSSDNLVQVVNVKDLQLLINQRIARIYSILYLPESDQSELRSGMIDGKRIMDLVKDKIAAMQSIENSLLAQRLALKERSAALTPVYSLLFSIFAIFILTIAYFRLRSESKLRVEAESSEAKIHRFFNEVPAILAILRGPEYRFEFANPSCMEFIGKKDVVGKTVREVLPEIESQGYIELLDKVYRGDEPYVGKEMPLILDINSRSDLPTYINFVLQAIPDEFNNTEGILAFCYDVSESVYNRKKIEDAEQRTRLAIEAAELGTFDWDLKSQKFESSARLLEIFGFKGQFNVKHQNLIDCFHPADRPTRDRAVAESYNKGSLNYEARIIRNDKSVRWVNVYGKILYGENKAPDRMYGMVMDITSQKSAFEELQESEARFRLLADSMPQLIWTGDASGFLYYFNKAVYEFSGLHYEELKKNGWLNLVHRDDRFENIRKWKLAIQTGKEFNIEHRFLNSSGEYRWMLSLAHPQRDANGNIQMWVGTSTDIDEQKHFMHELEQKVKERTQSLLESNIKLENTVLELERTNKELESFNYIASHDLQEPLRKIIAFSRRLEEKEKDSFSSQSKDYFDRIVASAIRMQNLIDGLLAYSLENEEDFVFDMVDLNLLVKEVEEDMKESIAEKKGCLEFKNLPNICAVQIQIYQLLVNLIGNALKYSKPDLPPVIRISASSIDGIDLKFSGARSDLKYWKISIEDNGIGFEQQYDNKIFELFQRLHPKSDYFGTGIGLAICKKIMNNHHGFITAVGKPGEGAIFNIFLPENQKSVSTTQKNNLPI